MANMSAQTVIAEFRRHRRQPRQDRPGLADALAALRDGDTLVVSKLDRPARSVPDARDIAKELEWKGVALALGTAVHDPSDPVGWMFSNIIATFAEFEADLTRMRTREDTAIARPKGKLRGKEPKLSENKGRSSGGCMTLENARSAISPRSASCHARPSSGR